MTVRAPAVWTARATVIDAPGRSAPGVRTTNFQRARPNEIGEPDAVLGELLSAWGEVTQPEHAAALIRRAAQLLPGFCHVIDASGPPEHFKYQLFGARVGAFNFVDLTGRRMLDGPWAEMNKQAHEHYVECVRTGVPVFHRVLLVDGVPRRGNGSPGVMRKSRGTPTAPWVATYARIALPLPGPNGFDRVLVAINVRPVPELAQPANSPT